MKTKIIEVTGTMNWGKFMLMRFDKEWETKSQIDEGQLLLRRLGWSTDHLWVLDLQTGEGAFFLPGGFAKSDLNKHKIWVCPMYEPFLEWLYGQDLTDISKLPDTLKLLNAPGDIWGHRRQGPK